MFKNWHFFRVFRIVLGVAAIYEGVVTNEWLFYIPGCLLLVSGILNQRCASGQCELNDKSIEEGKSN